MQKKTREIIPQFIKCFAGNSLNVYILLFCPLKRQALTSQFILLSLHFVNFVAKHVKLIFIAKWAAHP